MERERNWDEEAKVIVRSDTKHHRKSREQNTTESRTEQRGLKQKTGERQRRKEIK